MIVSSSQVLRLYLFSAVFGFFPQISLASSVYFTEDNFISASELDLSQRSVNSDDRYIRLISKDERHVLCTTESVAKQLMEQSIRQYMVNKDFTHGCYVNRNRFIHVVEIRYIPVIDPITHCFVVTEKEKAEMFLALWNSDQSIITVVGSTRVKYLELDIDKAYLIDKGAHFTAKDEMICK